MKMLGVLMLAATTASGGLFDGFGKPHALKAMFRPHVVQHGPPPAGGPMMAPPVDPGVAGAGFANTNRRFQATSSQVFFVDPTDMEIGWQTPGPDGSPVYLPAQLTVPARYNFRQGFVYRLKLSNIDNNPGLVLYPTIEVAPTTPATDAYLTHNPIPVQFTQEDFDQIKAGNFVTKVVYLPDPKFQELAIAGLYGADTIVSTRLEPGIDPILEADKRGTILLIVRCGAIDLEMPTNVGVATTPVYMESAPAPTMLGPGDYYGAPSGPSVTPEMVSPPVPPVDGLEPAPPAEELEMLEPPVSPAEPGPVTSRSVANGSRTVTPVSLSTGSVPPAVEAVEPPPAVEAIELPPAIEELPIPDSPDPLP